LFGLFLLKSLSWLLYYNTIITISSVIILIFITIITNYINMVIVATTIITVNIKQYTATNRILFLFTEYTSKRVCADSTSTTLRSGANVYNFSKPLKISFCDGLCGNGSIIFRQKILGYNVTWVTTSQFCLNQSMCSSWTDYIIKELKQSNISSIDVTYGACCQGDLCNMENPTSGKLNYLYDVDDLYCINTLKNVINLCKIYIYI